MTLRERIADLISGGALSRETERADRNHGRSEMWFSDAMEKAGLLNCAKSKLNRIAACETPNANATVKRMARIAREGV